MTFQCKFNLLICTAFFIVLFNSADANVCAGVASGTKLPHEIDCNRFILCDGGASMTLACRTSEPHFDRCTGKCINDVSVCGRTTCSESTTSATTQSSMQSSTVTSTSTTTNGPTTTRFVPPTVPIACSPACDFSNLPTGVVCACKEKWVCERGNCVCDETKICPFDQALCGTNCGCTENCNCDPNDTTKCLCKAVAVQCPFTDTDGLCMKNCGCDINCNCAVQGPPKSNCVCHDTCKCIGPPDLCPFASSECVSRCGCIEKCNLYGLISTCDANKSCPQ